MFLWFAAFLLTAPGLPGSAPPPAEPASVEPASAEPVSAEPVSAEEAVPQLTIERRVVEDDDEEGAPCRDAIEAQNWSEVITLCEALLDIREAALAEMDESSRDWGPTKENVETTRQNVDYAYRMQCEGAAQTQDWSSAIENCGPAAERYPDAFQFHLYLALGHQAAQDTEASVASFRAFLDGVQGNPEMAAQLGQQVAFAQKSLGIALLTTGDRTEAIPVLRDAAAANPGDGELQTRLGFALLEEGDQGGAEAALDAAISLNADNPQVLESIYQQIFRFGANSFNDQDHEAAIGRLTKYLSGQPDGEYATDAHFMVAEIAIRDNENALAMEHYRAFLERAPDDPRAADVNFRVGEYHFQRRECNTAERYYRRYMAQGGRSSQNAAYVEDILLDFEDGICEPGD